MEIFEAVFPIVAIAVAGYFISSRGMLSNTEIAALEKSVFWFVLPCLLFFGTATAELPEQMDWMFLLGFYGTVAVLYLFSMLLAYKAFGYKAMQQSVFGMGCAYSNVTILGVPICLEILGEGAFLPMFIIISIHNMSLFAFGTFFAERDRENGASRFRHILTVCKGLILSPITGSLLAGGFVNLIGLPIYTPLMDSVELMSRAAPPMALFSLGCSLTQYHIRGEIVPAIVMVGIKLLVLPALMWFVMFRLLTVDPLWGATAVVLSSMPVGVSEYVFSKRYVCGEAQAAAAIVISSILGVFSISLFAYFLPV